MLAKPRVSVIMPAYNCGRYVAQAIQSVMAQTVADWELQIVDDCSTDDTREAVKRLAAQEPRIHYTRLEQNGGPAAARNEALRRASGQYVAFLDSDDLWAPDKLERQLAFMEETGAVFSATAYDQMDEDGSALPVVCLPPPRTTYRKMLLLSNPIGNSTVMVDQEALGQLQVPPIRKRNDFALWLKILKATPCCLGMDDVLTHYRVRSDSVSSNKLAQAQYHWRLYREIEGLGVLESAFYVGCWAFVKGTRLGLRRQKSSATQGEGRMSRDNPAEPTLRRATLRRELIRLLHRNEDIFFAIKNLRLRFVMWFYRNMDDRTYIEMRYKWRTGRRLNLNPPTLYNEKVQYRKLYDHDERMKCLVDKAQVRDYVRERIGERYLTRLYGVYDTVDEIPFDTLPERFAMKLTNGSGFNYICQEKTPQEIEKIKKRFRQWLKLDFYMLGREWAYKGVKNRILCEEFLEDAQGAGLNDYKVFCFGGEPKVIQVDFDRFSNHRRNLYTSDWTFINERVAYENDPEANLPPPPNLDEMLACARKLSEGFAHVRVDFYDIGGRIVFGEMTFYHGAGYLHFEHEAFEKQLGDYWEL